jgi:hypothetical protein
VSALTELVEKWRGLSAACIEHTATDPTNDLLVTANVTVSTILTKCADELECALAAERGAGRDGATFTVENMVHEEQAGYERGVAAERARVVDEVRDALLTMQLYRTDYGDAVLYNAVEDALDTLTAAPRGTTREA